MKCTIPEISWHNREPVLSVDIHSINNEFYKVATAGGDNHVLIWQMTIGENGAVKQEVISDITRHQRAVNIVRWSPSGQYLASADDDANIIIWQLKTDNIPLLEGETGDKEIWIVYRVLRGHKEDIYDLCWSPSNLKLLSGSIDNTAILWDISKGKMDHILTDHKGFVQGVAWDPKNQILASLSTDRICRIFDTSGKNVRARILKGKIPVSLNHYLHDKEVKYFYDDTFKSFFRRLQFSPDGSLLIVPSGHMEGDDCKKVLNATLLFTLDNLNEPAALLPHGKQCSTVVRCCPILFELRQDGPEPLVDLPYRMIIAIGTDHDVILYDTQQRLPFARFQEIHYTRMTDLTWSNDGLLLMASSTDGFCALITFELKELGTPYVKEDSEDDENTLDVSITEDNVQEKDENVDINNSIVNADVKEIEQDMKKRSFIEQWVQKPPPKRLKPNPVDPQKNYVQEDSVDVAKKSPKRITPICLSPRRIKSTIIKEKAPTDLIDLTNDSPIKQLPENTKDTLKKVVPIPIEKALSNMKANSNKDLPKTAKRITPIPVKEQLLSEKTVKTDGSTNGSNNAIEKKLEEGNNDQKTTSKRITLIQIKEDASKEKPSTSNKPHEKVPSVERKDSPKRIKPIPVKESVDSKNESAKNSPKRIKLVSLNQKGSSKLEPQKTPARSITSFLIKDKARSDEAVGPPKPTIPVTGEEVSEDKGPTETIDLTSAD